MSSIASVPSTLEISSTPIVDNNGCSDSNLLFRVNNELSPGQDSILFRLFASNSNGTFNTIKSPFNFTMQVDISYVTVTESGQTTIDLDYSSNGQLLINDEAQEIGAISFNAGAIITSYNVIYKTSNLVFPFSPLETFEQIGLYTTDSCYWDRGINTVTGTAYSISYNGTGNC